MNAYNRKHVDIQDSHPKISSVLTRHVDAAKVTKEALAHCHEHIKEHGLFDHYYDSARPGYFRRVPLN